MSNLTYNGIALTPVKTRRYERTTVMSQDGGDYLYTRFLIEIQAIYNPAYTAYAVSSGNNLGPVATAPPACTLPADTDDAILHALMEPRRALTFGDEHANILTSPAPGTTVDCQGGPFPRACNVREISGTKTWTVSYTIETFLDDCPGNTSPPALISNRWTQVHNIDGRQMTRIETQGIAHFRLDSLLKLPDPSADQFRNICLPPLALNCRRTNINVILHSLGNVLSYQVVDEQEYYALGSLNSLHPDVLNFTARYVQETASGENNMPMPFLVAGVDITVFGKPTALRANLFRFAAAMTIAKLNLPGAGVADPLHRGQVFDIRIGEDLHQPSVSLMTRVKLSAAKVGAPALSALRQEFLLTDGASYQTSNPNLTNDGKTPSLPGDANTRGSVIGELFVPALQAACSAPYAIKQPAQVGSQSPAPTFNSYLPAVSVNMTGDMGSITTLYSQSATDDSSTYSEYKIDSRWEKDYHTLQLPVASNPVGGGGSSDASGGYVYDQPPQAEFVVLAAPTSTRVVDWTCERTGSRPELPQPVLADKNFVPLKTRFDQAAPELMADGQTVVWRASGQFRYGVRNAIGAGDDLPTCVLPTTTLSFDDYSTVASDFGPGIIDDGSGSSGSGGSTSGGSGGVDA